MRLKAASAETSSNKNALVYNMQIINHQQQFISENQAELIYEP